MAEGNERGRESEGAGEQVRGNEWKRAGRRGALIHGGPQRGAWRGHGDTAAWLHSARIVATEKKTPRYFQS